MPQNNVADTNRCNAELRNESIKPTSRCFVALLGLASTSEISDIAVHSWYGSLVLRNVYEAAEFLDVASYKNVNRWANEIVERTAYKRGSRVNQAWGPKETQVPERHDASDIK